MATTSPTKTVSQLLTELAAEHERLKAAQWYRLGATCEPRAAFYLIAGQISETVRMAYNAGVIARLFGVHLCPVAREGTDRPFHASMSGPPSPYVH